MTRSATKAAMAAALTSAGIEFTEDLTYAQLLQQYEALHAEHRSEENNDANQQNASGKDDDITNNDHESFYSDDNTSETTCDHNFGNEDLDAELNLLRKRYEILNLRKKMTQLQRELEADSTASAAPDFTAVPIFAAAPHDAPSRVRRPDFRDIEHAIVKFTGDDPAHDVNTFMKNFEDMIQLAGGDESFRLLCLRRSLDGAARLLLQSNDALTFEGLKKALIREFGDQLTSTDVERMLRARKWKPSEETLHYFVLHMQQLADRMGRARLTEAQLIDVIVGKLGISAANEALLCSANTIDELKSRLKRYAGRLRQIAAPTAHMTRTYTAAMDNSARTGTKPKPMSTAVACHTDAEVIKC